MKHILHILILITFTSCGVDKNTYEIVKVGNVRNTNFRSSNFPSPWTNVGFTATSRGMQSAPTGNINNLIEYEQDSHLDSFITTFKFKAVALSSVIVTNYHRTLVNLGGHVVKFNMIDNIITVYEATKKGTLPTVVIIQRTIPFTCAVGDVLVKYTRDSMIETYTIRNNQNEFSFTFDTQTVPAYTGGGYDKFGLVFLEGDIIVTEGQYSCQLNAEPDILILGNSIVNGDVNRSKVGGGQRGRWAGIVSEYTSCAIYSLGGNTTFSILRDRNFYFSLFKPKKAIFAIGINDTNFSDYLTNVEAFIVSCVSLDVEPILTTLQPRADRIEFCSQVSDFVKTRGLRYIDFRKTLTLNGLGVDLDTSLFTGDLIHPNVLGNAKMAQEVIDTLEL